MIGPQEQPWAAARRLAKELSAVLAECDDGTWYAHVMPAGHDLAVTFGALDGSHETEHPNQRVDRLGAELADALDGYMNQRFHARVYPSVVAGRSVFFINTDASERKSS